MNTVLQHSHGSSYSQSTGRTSIWAHFMSWCNRQEKNRFMWLAAALTGHGCFITPLTLFAVMATGNSIFFWAPVIAAMTMTVVTNLAALPTKITIPVFFLSLLIDAGVIVSCIVTSLTIAG